jgi:DNA-binding MarR family transcriptional regulator
MSEERQKVEVFLREWFKAHSIVYPSDVADALKMDYSKVVEIFDKLEADGKLEKAKFAGYKLEMRAEQRKGEVES